MKIPINPNVRKKDIIADALSFDKAVNKAEAKILQPENKNANEKILKPFLVISRTFLLSAVNIPAIVSPVKKENRNMKAEIVNIEQKQMRMIFLRCFSSFRPYL